MVRHDVFTKEKRSWVMSRIRGKHTKIERLMKKELKEHEAKFRVHCNIIGRPDFVFTAEKVAVFVDGCFWHKCPKDYIEPVTRKEFWRKKIGGNVKRDRMVTRKLQKEGWKVLRFWEHEVEKHPANVALKIMRTVIGRGP